MQTEMRILGWKAVGLRCPDHEIDCCRKGTTDPHRVSLIQMPNGTGKTTTLTLLRAALSGSAAGRLWDRATVKDLQKRGADSSHGLFEVRLLLNGRRVTVIMSFDFESGQVYYKTTRGPGQVDAFDPPVEFRRFMNEKFVNFFVFDGELAQHLLDRRHVQAEAVVESLFQISSFQTLATKVAEYWESRTRHFSATEERGLTRRQNRLEKLRERLTFLKAEKKKLEDQRNKMAAQLKKRQDAYYQEIKKEEVRSERLNKAESKAEQLRAKTREEAIEVLERMRDPHAMSSIFATMMHDLKTGLDRVKLPESAAREFFEELAAEADCVCGRPIDEETRDVIRSRAHQYLGSDDVALLNSMKTAIHEAVGQKHEESECALREKIEDLEKTGDEERDALNELHQLRLEAEQSDPAVKKAKDEIRELDQLSFEIDRQLEKFNSKDSEHADEQTFGIDVIEKRIACAENKLAEITHTIELKGKRDILTAIIDDAHRRARASIASEICADANSRIFELMPYNHITIDRIDQCLILKGQVGGSVGETLSVAYAFLATLFHRSDHKLPFVVDSPAGPIDLAVRPRIGELIPRLTDQFIAFTISSERNGFVPRLKQASYEEVQFITLFRKDSSGLENMARATDHDETADGLIVHDESFFNEFQIDLEEV